MPVTGHILKDWTYEEPRCLDHRCTHRDRPSDRYRLSKGRRPSPGCRPPPGRRPPHYTPACSREGGGQQLTSEGGALGGEAEFIRADVRHEDEVRDLVDRTVARFGRLDVAVNNAATEGQVGPITDQTAESYAATFDTNVLGVILSMKHEVRVMQGQGSGSIINIS